MAAFPQFQFERLAALFDATVSLPAPEREAFIEKMCGADTELRAELERLLASDVEVQQKPSSLPSRLPRFGIYQARELIGAGGMGAVYLATREDGEVRQRVAIKALASAFMSPLLEDRLRRERQILAELHHPNIASFLDGGITGDGFPYLVMEYVEGETIDAWCESRRLSVNLRLELFLKVCAAVSFAHQHKVVHRDLKPGNILVTPEGEPKLLDFGIARTLSGHGAVTQPTSNLFVTPLYASPEVLRNESTTVAADIYSLGVLLYELLSGARPYGRAGATPVELVESVLSADARRLSAAVTAETALARGETESSLSRRLRGDLEAIVAKAMAKAPEDRYLSVDQFTGDIRRHLTGRPVQAAAPSPFYTTRKFFARHRTPAVAVMVAVAVTGLAAASVWMLSQRAANAAQTSVAILPFLNLTGDRANEFISDGITDELTGTLGEAKGLRVVARTSAFQFKGKSVDVREIGRTLNAATVMEGSVAQEAGQLRIVVQMIRAKDGYHLWSQTYEGRQDDLQSMEAEIARASANILMPGHAEFVQSSRLMGTRSAEAHDLYLRALSAFRRGTVDSTRLSEVLAQKAIEKDPSYALPYWLYAIAEYTLGQMGVKSQKDVAGPSMAALDQALKLNPRFGDAHSSHALGVYTVQRDWPRAEEEFKLAVALGSNSAPSLYGWSLMTRGRFKEAQQQLARAEELDPIAAGPRLNRSIAWQFEGKYAEARAELQRVLELNPENPSGIVLLSGLDLEQKQCAAAESESEKLKRMDPKSILTRFTYAILWAMCGKPDQARKSFAEIEAEGASGVSFYQWALVHLVLGDKDRMFADLNKAVDGLENQTFYLKVYPAWKPMWSDPRFVAITRRLGLE